MKPGIVLMLPGWVFMVAAGDLFGALTGGLLAFAAKLAGSVIAFFMAWILRARVGQGDTRPQAPLQWFRRHGCEARAFHGDVRAARIAPVQPHQLRMRLRDFSIGTSIGILRILLAKFLIGARKMDLVAAVEGGGGQSRRSSLLIFAAIIPVIVLIMYLARRYGPHLADRELDDDQGQKD
jgi:uncharacterized membrane protein YdjX (TVP38/TMEM64 family)